MKVLLVLLSTIAINSCTTLTVANHNKVELRTVASFHPPESPTIKNERNIVCKDRAILHLANYNLPKKPNIDDIPLGDVAAEVGMLLDHIEVLRNELKIVAKDYGCYLE